MQPEITTKHLLGISDLTLVAPIKAGLIDSLETRTYLTRLRAALATLHALRLSSREHSPVRVFSDSTDRIRTITDLRMAILEPQKQLLLSVSFDRPWEPYLRIVWREVGTLLDLIFCNCDGYVTSFDNSFADYGRWIGNARTNVQFFYHAGNATFDDVQVLRLSEGLRRAGMAAADEALAAARLVAPDPADLGSANARQFPLEVIKQGMQALSIVHRLADFYPPGTRDGGILLRAAHELLRELLPAMDPVADPRSPDPLEPLRARVAQGAHLRFSAQLAWFGDPPAPPAPPESDRVRDLDDIQAGILTGHGRVAEGEDAGPISGRVTHGCVVLVGLDDPAAGAALLDELGERLSTEGAGKPADRVFVNVALSMDGLRALGLPARELAKFPLEFHEGMEERAGLIGDVRANHPRNWSLPEQNWPAPVSAGSALAGVRETARVPMSAVHLMVHLRTHDPSLTDGLVDALRGWIATWLEDRRGVRILSVQALARQFDDQGRIREHFGFVDGISQPEIGELPAPQAPWSNWVQPGELLLGYRNDRSDGPAPPEPLLDNGSFLVLRKLSQDVAAFQAMTEVQAAEVGLHADDLRARLMGRTLDGVPLAAPAATDNSFTYEGDAGGARCPFHSHMRRANPRTPVGPDGCPTVPRLARRAMTYGPRFDGSNAQADRGLMFLAFNASIAEQFEIIQRWVSGGNSTGALSDPSDPILGVPQLGEPRRFSFQDGNQVRCVALDDGRTARPLIRLEWGLYLFAPSKRGLARLAELAYAAAALPPAGPAPVVIEQGEQIIARLRSLEAHGPACAAAAWKAVLEDGHARSDGEAEAVWAAIRERHAGVLRTPYGVLVGSKAGVLEVYGDRQRRYSVSGYVPRLRGATGEMYLGLDDGRDYEAQSAAMNAAIMAIDQPSAFAAAHAAAAAWLATLVGPAKAVSTAARAPTWEVSFDVKELSDATLAALCERWFGLPGSEGRFRPGGFDWSWRAGDPPTYPGHFVAPSRYVFQPNPGEAAQEAGELRGSALLAAMRKFVTDERAHPPSAELARQAFAEIADDDLLARTLLGVLIGFLPTVEGNLRSVMNEWLGGATERLTLNDALRIPQLGELQAAYLGDPDDDAHAKAVRHLEPALRRTMQLRPAPEVGWRTACVRHTLGEVDIQPGERVAMSIVSATQEDLAAARLGDDGLPDVYPLFGGNRQADAHGTHACPGYQIAIGTLLGMLAALVELGCARPSAAPLTVGLRGTT